MSNTLSPTVHINLTPNELLKIALDRQEGTLAKNGAIAVTTGKRTGRSPKDRYIVNDASTKDTVDWGNINQPIEPEIANKLWQKAKSYLEDKETFVSYLRVGADNKLHIDVKVTTELAWHQLFTNFLFITPTTPEKITDRQWQLLNAAGLKLDPSTDGTNSDGAVIIDFHKRRVLLIGMQYAGEMKKAMFSVLNYLLPESDVLPMHCAANMGNNGDTALFFGLSGTGKTTLSADPERLLIGDDEHGWSDSGVFNFEGGCYAKCIDLSPEREPIIWHAITNGAVMENVVLDSNQQPDYTDSSLTQNTRAAYPRHHIPQRVESNIGGHPNAVLFLTCDMYGVLPPVAILNKQQAAYYFLSGYTALVGSTEMGGGSGIKPTFSTCFGAPFFPRPAQVYADLLMKRIDETGAQVYLVNTGWTGGAYGEGGQRFSIPVTRQIVSACLHGDVMKAATEKIDGFGLLVPTALPDIDSKLLNPSKNWQDPERYQQKAAQLIQQFVKNFDRFRVSKEIIDAGPTMDKA